LGFLVVYLGAMVLRAQRFRMLLLASGVPNTPGVADLTTLALVQNLFVNLLPARSGSLSYVILLNQKLEVQLAACFSSLAFSVIFDLMGMLPLFLVAIISLGPSSSLSGPWLWAALGLLTALGAAAMLLLDRALGLASRLTARLAPDPDQGRPSRLRGLLARVAQELDGVARDVVRVKSRGVFWPVLGLSLILRLGKYLALYLLILALARQWGPGVTDHLNLGVVLFSLVAAEAVVSLPIGGLAGLGAYMGTLRAALGLAGLDDHHANMLSLSVSVLAKATDYSLGGLALMRLAALKREESRPVGD
jgi:hypothetical protein